MEVWDLYWITRFDGIKSLVSGLTWACIVPCIMGFIGWMACECEANKDYYAKWLKTFKYGTISFIVLLTVQAFTPTTKQVLAFISVDYITHSDKVIDTADKLYEAVHQGLDGYLEKEIELEGEKE